MARGLTVSDCSNLVDPQLKTQEVPDAAAVREFYDRVYYADVSASVIVPAHYRRLARKLQPWKGKRLLDVACGTGQWLGAAAALGAIPAGIDISQKALEVCRKSLPHADVRCGPAEQLPFADGYFDVISCLGALEHFLDPDTALHEMVRVAKPSAIFILLVPNSGFLPLRFGLYSGTEQTDVREELRSLAEWGRLFEGAGLRVRFRWRDLHVLAPSWIFRGSWYAWPMRAAQALALPLWPLEWQYQVYHLCTIKS
jgi:SAM-dependent methyltransferase